MVTTAALCVCVFVFVRVFSAKRPQTSSEEMTEVWRARRVGGVGPYAGERAAQRLSLEATAVGDVWLIAHSGLF